jgi:hypothetical protein
VRRARQLISLIKERAGNQTGPANCAVGTRPWSAEPTGRAICRRRLQLAAQSEPGEGAPRRPPRPGRELGVARSRLSMGTIH